MRDVLKPLLSPTLIHDFDPLFAGRWRLAGRIFGRWEKLHGHTGDLNNSAERLGVLDRQLLGGQRPGETVRHEYGLTEFFSVDQVENVALQPPRPAEFAKTGRFRW